MTVLVRREAWQASLTSTAATPRRQDFEVGGKSDLYRVHPYDGLKLPQSPTPEEWWIYQDTMVDLESLRDVLERAFAAAGIHQRPAEGAHGSHEAGLGAASALPPPQPRHADVEVASPAPMASTSVSALSEQQQEAAVDAAAALIRSTSVETQSAAERPASDAEKAADRVERSAAELKDAAEAEGRSAASDRAADAMQEPQEDEEPDEDEIADVLPVVAKQ
jgi:hypothetical protein